MKQYAQENVGPAKPHNSAIVGSQQQQQGDESEKPKRTNIGALLIAQMQERRRLQESQQEQSQQQVVSHPHPDNSLQEANVSYDPQQDIGNVDDDEDFDLEIEA